MNAQYSPTMKALQPGSFRRDSHLAGQNHSSPLPGFHFELNQDDDETLYRELLECAADGIYGLDVNGYVSFMNPAARRMTGWTIDDLHGRTQHSMVHHSHADGSVYLREECPIYAALTDGLVHRRDDEVFWRKDGTCFPVSYTSSPIFRDGLPAGAVIIFRSLENCPG